MLKNKKQILLIGFSVLLLLIVLIFALTFKTSAEKEREEQVEKKIQEELGESEKSTRAVSNPYQCTLENKYFRKSNAWLDNNNVIKSIWVCILISNTKHIKIIGCCPPFTI